MSEARISRVPLAVALLSLLLCTTDGWAQTKIQRLGVLARPVSGPQDDYNVRFMRALAELGWIDGENVSVVHRTAEGDPPQYDASASELVKLQVDLIYANNAPATRAAFAATRTIPIVGLDFTNDPVAAGYAKNYFRPGSNLTGFFLDAPGFAGKWLEQLKTLIPGLSRVAVLWDPSPGDTHLKAVQDAAQSFNVQLQIIEVRTPNHIELALSALRGWPQALLILPSPMTWTQSARLAKLAMKHRLPATSMPEMFAQSGGLLSYGPDLAEAVDRCAMLVSQVLNGAKPGDLPVERPRKLPLTINLKTAKLLNVTVPQSVLIAADKVIR
jgi:putative tryptophan/tyrosine transport system substrate-binding protein